MICILSAKHFEHMHHDNNIFYQIFYCWWIEMILLELFTLSLALDSKCDDLEPFLELLPFVDTGRFLTS